MKVADGSQEKLDIHSDWVAVLSTGSTQDNLLTWQNNQTNLIWFGMVQCTQGLHRLEKYLNIQDCLEKSLKNKFALKSTWKNTQKYWKVLEFYYLQEDSALSLET